MPDLYVPTLGHPNAIATQYQRKRKSASQEIDTSTVLSDLTDLLATLVADNSYLIRAYVPFTTDGATSGGKFAFTLTNNAGANAILAASIYDGINMIDVGFQLLTIGSNEIEANLPAGDHVFVLEGSIEHGPNDGVLQLQFAQKTSHASAIRALEHGFLEVIRY